MHNDILTVMVVVLTGSCVRKSVDSYLRYGMLMHNDMLAVIIVILKVAAVC